MTAALRLVADDDPPTDRPRYLYTLAEVEQNIEAWRSRHRDGLEIGRLVSTDSHGHPYGLRLVIFGYGQRLRVVLRPLTDDGKGGARDKSQGLIIPLAMIRWLGDTARQAADTMDRLRREVGYGVLATDNAKETNNE